jgi:hypothetical protein
MSRVERLAAALLADRRRTDDGKHNIVPCFACGHGFIYKGRRGNLNGRFCSMRCQQWIDDGNAGHGQDWQRPQIDHYGITDWKIVAGPPGSPLRDAFERRGSSKARKAARQTNRNKIPNYIVRANGHGYWQPSAASRLLGFASVDCGFDGDEARSKARALNIAASDARKRAVDAGNTNREAA